jgi:hypothetical protein
LIQYPGGAARKECVGRVRYTSSYGINDLKNFWYCTGAQVLLLSFLCASTFESRLYTAGSEAGWLPFLLFNCFFSELASHGLVELSTNRPPGNSFERRETPE